MAATDHDHPAYDAVIPAEVRYDPQLRPNAKLLYGEIRAMSSKEGYCWATNAYFAGLYGVSIKTISELIRALEQRGHVRVEVLRDERGQVLGRRIWVSLSSYRAAHRDGEHPAGEEQTHPPKNRETSPEKGGDPPPKNREKNNTRENISPLTPQEEREKIAQSGLPDPMKQTIADWCEYKREKRQAYKPRGLQSLLTVAQRETERHGIQAVAELVEESMAAGWQGVAWDKLGRDSARQPAKQKEVEEW